MKMEVLQFGEASASQLDKFRMMPSFRKATRAMSLASASIEDACSRQEKIAAILKASPGRFGLVCGSAFGELETTKDFLKMFADTGVARPLLFQNSLHNSTSGFASIHFHFTGPVITVSHGLFAFENCLETASLLLQQKQADFVVVTYVETSIADLTTLPEENQDSADQNWSASPIDMSMSVLLTSPEVAKREALSGLATLHDVICQRKIGSKFPSYAETSRALQTSIAAFRDAIMTAHHPATNSENVSATARREFRFERSNQAVSRFEWSQG